MSKYGEFNLDISKIGYFILFKHQKGLFGDLIVKQQQNAGFIKDHACYSHVGVSCGGQWVVDVVPPKTKITNITKKYKGREIRIVRYKNENYQKKGRYKVALWSASLCNLRYDWGGVIGFILKWVKNNNRLYFCSENCASSLQKEYPEVFATDLPEDIMPAHFCLPNYFECVWQGRIP